MSEEFNLLVDDQDSQINYICPSENQVVLGAFSNKTWSTIKDASCKKGWFEYKFFGTGIHVLIPTKEKAQTAAVLLDNVLFKPDENGLFEAHDLPDGQHNFTYGIGEVSAAPVFDYLTITAGPSTPLKGKTLIVDDAEGSLVYGGKWNPNVPKPATYEYSTKLFRDTAHWSSSVGDTVEFKFIGSSVAVYGLAANITSGNIAASYTIDGVTSMRSIPRGTPDSLPMTEFFRADLQPGPHTLFINLTDIASPRAYGIDFIAYNSSVEKVTDLPGFQLPVANSAPDAEETAGTGKGGSIVRNAILGGVLGAVGFMALVGLILLILKKRSSKSPVRLDSNNGPYEDISDKQSTVHQPHSGK